MNRDPKTDSGHEEDGRKKSSRSIYRWLLTGILLAITGWLLSRQDPEFLSQITLDWHILIPAGWLLALYTILLSERFRILTQLYLGRSVLSTSMFLRSLIVSRILNGIFPQAGNIYRGSHLHDRIGLPWSGYLAIVITGMMMDIIVISAVLGLILIDAHLVRFGPLHFVQSDLSSVLILTLVATIISLLCIFHFIRKYGRFRHTNREGAEKKPITTLWRSIIVCEHFPGLILQSLITVALLGAVIWLILISMGFDPGLLGAATLMVAARAAQYIVITPGNLGVRELIYAGVGSQLTIGMGAAVAASILLRIMNWIVLGTLILFSEGLSICAEKFRQKS